MRITLKQNILFMVAIITVSSILGCILLIQNARMIGKNLQVETEARLRAMVGQNAEQIETALRVMETNVTDMATAGEAFFAIVHGTGQEITRQIQGYLVNNFKKLPEAIGGGLWYEPNALYKDTKRFGPYAFRENNRVQFTWDLNTATYDYHNQPWYRMAIPVNCDRNRSRPQNIYWTDPYFDQAATSALMITVDALMYDSKGRIIGISTVDFSLEKLQSMVTKMMVTPGSLPFAADLSSGLLISYPANPAKVLQRLKSLEWGDVISEDGGKGIGKILVKELTLKTDAFSLFYTSTKTGLIMGILVPHKELYARINDLNHANMVTSVAVIVFQILLFLAIAFFTVRRICNPISKLTLVAREIAEGKLNNAKMVLDQLHGRFTSSRDETGLLFSAFQSMTEKLNALIGQIQDSGNQVTASSTEIAASSRGLEATMNQQAASTSQVSASSRMISKTAENLSGTVDEVSRATTETAALAEAGQTGLSGMEASMQDVLKGTASVSAKLEAMKKNALVISSVVVTITRVADQTNLLSLNAAIEAEKAGEYGLGFSVVANEIRRLADQTAVAALDIEDMVSEMEKSVSTGASEMETFSGVVQTTAHKMKEIGSQLGGIMAKVRTLPPGFEAVSKGMAEQSRSAGQISETMEHLNTATQDTLESLREFKIAAEDLNEAALGLQEQVSRFEVIG
ncbi:MAG: methyl-accepting chemotaxis protein [Deltaproteobacteria bacterium]|nr:methyl-accepting chemotaxis protein [Deltaproteobacteria bacterium]